MEVDSNTLANNSQSLTPQELIVFHKQLLRPVQLTQQQAITFKLLAQGFSSKKIARAMGLSYRTIEGNIAKLMDLLGCASSKELVSLYHDQP